MSKPPMVFDPASHTGAGRSKRRPPPRPSKDSLPKHECDWPGCGGTQPISLVFTGQSYMVQASNKRAARWFCSLGCLGRWSALQEVRQ